jgi:hypothetical protein
MLDHVPLYFDDTEHSISHRFAGELLAIDEFNAENAHVKIDQWRGVKNDRPFPEANFLQRMYMAHDLEAFGRQVFRRAPLERALSDSLLTRPDRQPECTQVKDPRNRQDWFRSMTVLRRDRRAQL